MIPTFARKVRMWFPNMPDFGWFITCFSEIRSPVSAVKVENKISMIFVMKTKIMIWCEPTE